MKTVWTCTAHLIEVGVITGAYGLRGWVKVKSHAARHLSGNALLTARRWQLLKNGQSECGSEARWVTVLNTKPHRNALIAQFAECTERETAQRLEGWQVLLRRSDFPELPKNEYYWADLIGLQVINTEGAMLGAVGNLLDHGAHAVLCVESQVSNAAGAAKTREWLIPFVNAYIRKVDLAHRQIIVDWPSDWMDEKKAST